MIQFKVFLNDYLIKFARLPLQQKKYNSEEFCGINLIPPFFLNEKKTLKNIE